MKLDTKTYESLLTNPVIPDSLKKELANTARLERWSFIGT